MTPKLDIDKLVWECGAVAQRRPDYWIFDENDLVAYTRRVMEECALACWPDPIPDSVSPYMQGRIDCRDAIREMMP